MTASASLSYRGVPINRLTESQLRWALYDLRDRAAPLRLVGSLEMRQPMQTEPAR